MKTIKMKLESAVSIQLFLEDNQILYLFRDLLMNKKKDKKKSTLPKDTITVKNKNMIPLGEIGNYLKNYVRSILKRFKLLITIILN